MIKMGKRKYERDVGKKRGGEVMKGVEKWKRVKYRG